MTSTGERQRAVKVHDHAHHPIKVMLRRELVDKATRRAHGADGVRTRRPEAYLKQIESAYEHCVMGFALRSGARLFSSHCNPDTVMTLSVPSSLRRATTTALMMGVLFACWVHAEDAGWRAYQRGDYGAARAYYQSAARNGDRLAQYNVAMMMLRGEGGGEDLDGGVGWLKKAAEAGMPEAQYNLGLLYEGGVGVSRTLTAATAWWEKAAQQGHVQAQIELATQYFLGRGAPKDWKLAAKWYESAAENGDPAAQYIIGSFYEHGDGVEQNLKKALDWYAQAARQGDVGAAAQAKDVARRIAEAQSSAPR